MNRPVEGASQGIRPVVFGGRFAEVLAGPLHDLGYPLSGVVTRTQRTGEMMAARYGAPDVVIYSGDRNPREIFADQQERHPDDTIAALIVVPQSRTLAIASEAVDIGVPALTLKFGTGYDIAVARDVARRAGNGVYGAGQFWEHYQSGRARERMHERIDQVPVVRINAAWHGEPHHSLWGLTEGTQEEIARAQAEGCTLDSSGGPMADRGAHLLWFIDNKIGAINVTWGAEYRYADPVVPEQTTADASVLDLDVRLHVDGREVPGTVTTHSRLPRGQENVYIALKHDDHSKTIVTKKQLLVVDADGVALEEPISHTESYASAGRGVAAEFIGAVAADNSGILVCNFANAAALFGHISEGQRQMANNSYLIKKGEQLPQALLIGP